MAGRCIGCGECLAACPNGAISWGDRQPRNDWRACTACGACVDVCYASARELAGRRWDVAELWDTVSRDRAFWEQSGGGLTVSGGEPLAQPEFLLALLETCTRQGVHTVVDTCGYAPWVDFERILPHVNLFLYDVKLIDDVRHQRYTGVSNQLILKNLSALDQAGGRVRLRFPVIPGITDGEANVYAIGELAAGLSNLEGIDLLPYHHIAVEKYRRLDKTYRLAEVQPPSDIQIEAVAVVLRAFGLDVEVGG